MKNFAKGTVQSCEYGKKNVYDDYLVVEALGIADACYQLAPTGSEEESIAKESLNEFEDYIIEKRGEMTYKRLRKKADKVSSKIVEDEKNETVTI